jgi:hypothetical protein
MDPNLRKISGTETAVSHAHLLAREMNGHGELENPAAVMAEVAFRATHISSLMEEMFETAKNKDWWETDEP